MHLPPRSARPARLALATLALVVATLLAGLLAAPAPARAVASQVLEPGASVDVSGVGEDTRLVVSRAGTYSFSGTSSRATIYVNASPGDEVTLVLEDGLALTPSSGAPIEVFAEYDASEQARVDVLMGVGSNASLTGGSRSPAIRVTTFDMTNSQAAPPGDDPIVTIGCQDDRYGTLLDLRGGSGVSALAIAGYGDVALTGGSVYATSGGGGAGVSCPEGATVAAGEVRQGAFVVTGGLLSAQGGSGAPGIGSTRGDVAVRIEGGTVSVNGGAGAPAIGSVEGDATVSVTGGSVTPASGSAPGVPAIGSVSGTADLSVSGGTVDVEGFSYGELALGSAGGAASVRISGGTVAVGLASCGSSAEVGEDDDPPAVVEVTGGSYTGFAAGTGLANDGVGRDDMAVNAAGTVVWRTVVELEGAKVRTSVESLDVRGAAPAYGTGGIQTRPMWVQDASRPVVVVWIPINAEVVGATDDYVNCYSGEVHPTPSASAGLSYGALERVPNLTIDANSDAGYDGSVWVTRFSTTIQVEEEVVSNDDRMLAGVFDAPEGGNMVMDAQYRLQPNVEGWTGPAGRWERGGAPFTLYAQWRDPYFTVSFDANGGTGSMDPQEIDLGVTTALSPCAYQRTGHSLTGWNTEADGTGTAYAPGAEVSDLAAAGETVTLYAQWEPVTYTLRYDGNGGVTGHGYTEYSFTQTYGDPITIEPNIYFRRAGYEFVDWNTKPDGSGDSYRGWDVVGDLSGTAGDTVTLYAQWEPLAVSSYEISFEANAPATASTEPTGSMDAQEDVPCGTTVTLPSVGFRLPGYRFAGWNTEPDGTGDAYADAAEVRDLAAPGESVTLYAQWKPLTYHVTFVHGEGQGATYTQAFAFDDAAALVSNVFVGPTGAAFAGWRDEATGALYADCAQVVNACTVGADGSLEGHTFVAQWARSGVTVVLAHDGAPLALDDPGTEIELVPEGGGTPLTGFAPGAAEGTYVLADVEPGTYGIDVGTTGDDGSLLYPTAGLSVTVEAGTPAVLRVEYFTVTVEAGETGVAPWLGAAGVTSRAVLAGTEVSVGAGADGGAGYVFDGWTCWGVTPGGWSADAEEQDVVVEGTTILTAHARSAVYEVSFDANGGEGTMDAQDMVCHEPQPLFANAFSLEGAVFAGWNTEADGSGDAYVDGEVVRDLSFADGGTVTLYAQWRPVTYEVAFDANGGEGAMAPQQMTYGESAALAPGAFARAGHVFAGWNTEADGTGDAYADGAEVLNLSAEDGATVTLYAQWDPEPEPGPAPDEPTPTPGPGGDGGGSEGLPRTGDVLGDLAPVAAVLAVLGAVLAIVAKCVAASRAERSDG